MHQSNIPSESYPLASSNFPETIQSCREVFRILSEKNTAYMALLHASEEYLQERIHSQLLLQIGALANVNEWRK